MNRRREPWCRCSRNKVCAGHADRFSRLELAFERVDKERPKNPFLPADDGEVVVIHADGRSTALPGDDVYDYRRARYPRGQTPVTGGGV